MELLLTVEQAAVRLQLTPWTIREQLKAGRLRGVKRGRQWRVPESALTESAPQSSNWESAAAAAAPIYAASLSSGGGEELIVNRVVDKYTSIKEQVEYGLDSIDPERTVQVPIRDLLFVYQVIGEYIRFFHQPMHYPTLDYVNQFLGTYDKGAFHLLHQCYYYKLRDVFPQDIDVKFSDSDFDHPKLPFYYKPTDESK